MGWCAKWAALLALVAMLAACASKDEQPVPLNVQDTEQLEQVYQDGRAAYLAGRYDEATGHFARVANADPQHLKARINWGASLSRGGRPLEALGHFQQVLALEPDNVAALYNWGAAWPASASMRKRWSNSNTPSAWKASTTCCRRTCNGHSTTTCAKESPIQPAASHRLPDRTTSLPICEVGMRGAALTSMRKERPRCTEPEQAHAGLSSEQIQGDLSPVLASVEDTAADQEALVKRVATTWVNGNWPSPSGRCLLSQHSPWYHGRRKRPLQVVCEAARTSGGSLRECGHPAKVRAFAHSTRRCWRVVGLPPR